MLLNSLRRRAGTMLALGTALTLLLAGTARAATIEVNSSADPTDGTNCTLRQAIQNADDDAQTNASCVGGTGSDTITFDNSLFGDTITLTAGELLIDPGIHLGTLTIQGLGAAGGLEVSGNDLSRVFRISLNAVQTANAVTISGLAISNGAVNGNGGGIFSQGSLHLDHDSVVDNTANATSTGGAVNQATALGGGIESSGGLLDVTSSEIAGNTVAAAAAGGSTSNTATARGAGIHASGDFAGILTIARSSITGNTASAITTGNGEQANAEGGGVWSSAGAQTTITESTIANNTLSATGTSSQETGGGVASAITLGTGGTLQDDTVTGNDGANLADAAGGGVLQIRNTIVAGASGASNCSGVTSLGHNLTEDATCGSATGDIPSTPPQLKSLGFYAGPTQTEPPNAGSPAIDKGVAIAGDFDQRDLQRTWQFDIPDGPSGDGTDIGSVEIQGPVIQSTDPTSPNADQSPRVIGTAEPGSLVELHSTGDCSDSAIGAGTATAFASPGIAPTSPLALGSTTTFHAASFYGTAESICSPSSIAYAVPTPTPTPTPTPPSSTPAPTGQRAAALKKCKKKHKKNHNAKQFKKCKKKANRLPV
jgi:hypothetical protein